MKTRNGIRKAALALAQAVLLAAPAAAKAPEYGDPGVVVEVPPEELWRDRSGALMGRREGDGLVLTYDFRQSPGDPATREFSACPDQNYVDAGRAVACESAQDAIVRAINEWARESGHLSFRRRSGAEPVHVWVSFAAPEAWRRIQPGRTGGAAIASASLNVDLKEGQAFMYFNRAFCWHLGDAGVCPQRREPFRDGERLMVGHLPGTALHEFGHVLGFGHPELPTDSIMYKGDEPPVEALTGVDRRAVRMLYDRAAASFDAPRGDREAK